MPSSSDKKSLAISWATGIVKWRWLTLALIGLVTGGLGYYASTRLVIDNSLESWAPPDSTEVQTLYDFRATFGKPDAFLVLVEGDVFTPSFLSRLAELHDALAKIEVDIAFDRGQRALPKEVSPLDDAFDFDEDDTEQEDFDDNRVISRVTSLINVRQTRSENGSLRVEKLMQPMPAASELSGLRGRVLNDQFLVGQVVDKTGRFALLSAHPVNMPDDEVMKVHREVVEVVKRFEAPDFVIKLTGVPAIGSEINAMVEHDFTLLGSISLAFIVVILIALFRSFVGVVGPFLVVVASIVWTLGFMALMGYPLSILSTILPAFLFCVGVADSVHFLSIYARRRLELDTKAAIIATVSTTAAPIFFTSVTTMGGLFSLSFASVRVIAEMGIAGGVGVICAWFLSVTLLPPMMTFGKRPLLRERGNTSDWCDTGLGWLVGLSKPIGGRPNFLGTLIASLTIFCVAAAGIAQLDVYHDDLELVPEDSPVKVAVETLDKHIGGTATAELMITAKEGDLKTLKVVEGLDNITKDVLAFRDGGAEPELVTHAVSVVNVVKETHRAFMNNAPEAYALPKDDSALSQLLLLFEGQSPEETKKVASVDWGATHLTFRVRWREATGYKGLVDHIESSAAKHLGDDVIARGTGSVFIACRLVSLLLRDLAVSFGSAFLFVAVFMVFMLRDLKLGLIAMLPNLFPIALVLGGMGWLGVPIDLNSLLVASIALGIAVDDTVHFLHHFQEAMRRTRGDVEASIQRAVSTAGRAMVMTSIILIGGFVVFGFASTEASVRFGLLTAATIVCALLVDMTVLPATLRWLYPLKHPIADDVALPHEGRPVGS